MYNKNPYRALLDASIFLLRLFLFTKQYGQASSVVTLESSCFVGNIIAHHYEYGNAQSFCCGMYSIFLRITLFGQKTDKQSHPCLSVINPICMCMVLLSVALLQIWVIVMLLRLLHLLTGFHLCNEIFTKSIFQVIVR